MRIRASTASDVDPRATPADLELISITLCNAIADRPLESGDWQLIFGIATMKQYLRQDSLAPGPTFH